MFYPTVLKLQPGWLSLLSRKGEKMKLSCVLCKRGEGRRTGGQDRCVGLFWGRIWLYSVIAWFFCCTCAIFPPVWRLSLTLQNCILLVRMILWLVKINLNSVISNVLVASPTLPLYCLFLSRLLLNLCIKSTCGKPRVFLRKSHSAWWVMVQVPLVCSILYEVFSKWSRYVLFLLSPVTLPGVQGWINGFPDCCVLDWTRSWSIYLICVNLSGWESDLPCFRNR